MIYNDKEFALEETKKFNGYLSLFDRLMNSYNEGEEPEVKEDIDIKETVQDTIKNISPEEE